jgi:serine/threonine protein kinase
MDLNSFTEIDFNKNTYANMIMKYSHYIPIEDVSKPNFIPLIKCLHKVEKVLYSVNIIKLLQSKKKLLDKSIQIQSKLINPSNNIVQLKEYIEKNDYRIIVMEYLDTRLEDLLQYEFKKGMPEKIAFFFFRQILNGVKHIHNLKCIHRDLQINQIFIKDYLVKISGFTLAYIVGGEDSIIKILYKSRYNPPELCNLIDDCFEERYAEKVDVYSLGIILYLLLHNIYPNSTPDDDFDFPYNIEFNSKLSIEVKELVINCLLVHVENRYTVRQIERSSWFTMMSDLFYQIEKGKTLTQKEVYSLLI